MRALRLGVVHVVFGVATPPPVAAEQARRLGFEHIDVPASWNGRLVLPVGDRIASAGPQAGCSCPALAPGEGAWERMVRAYRRTPTALMEPWAGSALGSNALVREFLEAVPGARIVVDTGHVACWGGDPVELLPWAGHVQLRQARTGVNQALEGDVDFAAVITRLRELDYGGLLSVEYFDLPQLGWPLDDPVGHAVALAETIRPLLA